MGAMCMVKGITLILIVYCRKGSMKLGPPCMRGGDRPPPIILPRHVISKSIL